MDAFARARPLWELTLMEGLEDGGAALIVKVHHSLSDGVSGVRMLALVADPKRKPRSLGTLPPAPPDEPMDQLTLVASTVGRAAEQLTRLAWQPAAAIPALARAARDPAGFARGAVAMA